MNYILNKTRYCNAIQCKKMLWLYKNNPELCSESLDDSKFEFGKIVGDLARNIFDEHKTIEFNKDLQKMIDETQKLLDSNTKIICEASFNYDGLFCAIDILKNNGNNEVELYEVKSSTGIKDIYKEDISYQYYVLTCLGFNVVKASIVYINNKYTRQGDLDLNKLFIIKDFSSHVKNNFHKTEKRINEFKDILLKTDEPNIDLGKYCTKPYKCGFWEYCTKDLPKPNVFDVARFNKRFEFYDEGLITFDQLFDSKRLNHNQHMQVGWEVNKRSTYIDKEYIKDFINTLYYPLYFLDFETYQSPIPQFENSQPYEQITFQYSLHYYLTKDGELQHKEFLAYPGKDPRRELAERLCKDIPLNSCVLAYNMSFEKSRIKKLAELYPDLSDHLTNIRESIKDLMIPFQQKKYYDKEFNGLYTIKRVLPALFPNDPSLDYHNLEGVHHGAEASQTFIDMAKMNENEMKEARKNLLAYCCLDTFALVKLLEKLNSCVNN